ncbi:MAG TPA: YbaB/EbfC family nucleoid-associated protein [Amycolatopsis sp.]|uniref:YbaB/EbfC family nucleoid-associated protein n=1 Tax=Flexivirga sp. TaxID=1962927 RepID=UPI002C8EC40F|nr:YbaB/EbfC family nucleoid-associated protein [Amycolatopsis sp.]
MALNVAKLRAQAAELDAQLAAARHTAKSPDGVVTAVVTGSGELVDLTITEAALHGPHPQEIGPAAVAAVTAARRAAIAVAAPQMRAVLDDKHPRRRRTSGPRPHRLRHRREPATRRRRTSKSWIS